MDLFSLKARSENIWLCFGLGVKELPEYDMTIFKNLQDLDFSLGYLKEIPDYWSNIISPNIRKINGFSNQLKNIPISFNKVFKRYKNISVINFGNNKIKILNRIIFPINLRELRLSFNFLEKFRIRSKSKKLKIITLNNNCIKKINTKNIERITNLYLEYNNIQKINLKNNKNIKILEMQNNNIRKI